MRRWIMLLSMVLSPAATVWASSPTAAAPQLREVIVTAERRQENIQHTTLAIQAISGQSLVDTGANGIAALTRLVPGVQIGVAASVPQVYIRGVGSNYMNAYNSPAILMSVDGVPNSEPWASSGELYDLARVEVIKGPQGTLYGRNATGGAVNIITNRPALGRRGGYVSVDVGNYDQIETTGAVDIPLSGSVAARVAFHRLKHQGYLTNGYNDADQTAGRAELLWKPPEYRMSLLLEAEYVHEGGKGSGDVPITPSGAYANPTNPWQAPPPGNPLLPADQPRCIGPAVNVAFPYCYQADGYQRLDNWRLNAQFKLDLGFGTLTVIPAYWHIHADIFGHPRMADNYINTTSQMRSVEARLASNDDKDSPFTWLVGAYWSIDNDHVPQSFWQPTNYPHPPYRFFPILNPVHMMDESYAAFTQDTYKVTSAFRITAGLRYTYEKKTKDGYQQITASAAACSYPSLTSYDVLTGRCTIAEIGAAGWHSIQWLGAAEYRLSPTSMVYVRASTGEHAGGFFQGLPPDTYKPEWLNAYSLGTKNRFIDNRLQFNAELFDWYYRDMQVSTVGPLNPPTIFGSVTLNAGRAHIYGLDVQAKFAATARDVVGGDVEYLHAQNTQFVYPVLGPVAPGRCSSVAVQGIGGFENCSGTDLLNAPKWDLNLNYRHVFPLSNGGDLVAEVASHIETGAWLGFDETVHEQRSAYHKTNLSVTYASPSGNWTFQAYVNNVENAAVRSLLQNGSVTRSPWVFLSDPRVYGVRATLHFR